MQRKRLTPEPIITNLGEAQAERCRRGLLFQSSNLLLDTNGWAQQPTISI
jgi:hypothetical protein